MYALRCLNQEDLTIQVQCAKAGDFEPVKPFQIAGRQSIYENGDSGILVEPERLRCDVEVDSLIEMIKVDRWATCERLSEATTIAAGRIARGAAKAGRAMRWREIAAPTRPGQVERPGRRPVARTRWVPPAEHPWREAVRRAVERRVARALPGARRPSLASLSASP